MSTHERPTACDDEQQQNRTRTPSTRDTARPPYNCPRCDRPTLSPTPDEIVSFRCGVCGERVDERGGNR